MALGLELDMPAGRRPITIGMALYGDLTYDSRVRREAATLADGRFDVALFCLAADSNRTDLPANVRVLIRRPTSTAVLPGTPSPFLGSRGRRRRSVVDRARWLIGYVRNVRAWGRSVVAASGSIDIWHLHDLTALAAVAPLVAKGTPVIYDAHELFLETGSALRLPAPARTLLRAYERHLVSKASAVVTVNEKLASVLQRRYRPSRIEVVHNCPDLWSPPARRPTLIRDAAGVPEGAPIVLYHGALSAHRGVEQLMDAILEPGLEDAHLVLLGFGETRVEYEQAAGDPRFAGRLHVLDPVAPSELLPWVASADIGAMPIQASTLNHYLSTPNKLFECVAAGTPIVASDFPAMSEVVLGDPAGPLGAVCDPTSVPSVAAAIQSILGLDDPSAEAMRSRCVAAARRRWNWQVEAAGLMALYSEVARARG